jgi:Mn-dependent DtxR family transcriptional regulator
MTRMKRNDPKYSIEGGNPLTNPYACWPEETLTEEEIEAKSLMLAQNLIEDWLSKKERGTEAQIEIMEALCSDEFVEAFDNLLIVSKLNDCTKLSVKYFDAMQLLVKAFEKRLVKQFEFIVENT